MGDAPSRDRYAPCFAMLEQLTSAAVFEGRTSATAPDDVAWVETSSAGPPLVRHVPIAEARARAAALASVRSLDVLTGGSAPRGGVLALLVHGEVGLVMAFTPPKPPRPAKKPAAARSGSTSARPVSAGMLVGVWRVARATRAMRGRSAMPLDSTDTIEQLVLRADGTFEHTLRTPSPAGWRTAEGTWRCTRASVSFDAHRQARHDASSAPIWQPLPWTFRTKIEGDELVWHEALTDGRQTRWLRRVT